MKHHIYACSLLFAGALLFSCASNAFAQEINVESVEVVPENTSIQVDVDAETTELPETESETETELAEPEIASFPQGIYELACVTAPDLVMDITYCTDTGKDFKTLQVYESLDINQQKFYIENLPGSGYRMSVMHSGDALTSSEANNSISVKPMSHPQGSGVADNQKWIFRATGNGRFYIQAENGGYLTVEKATAFNGASVSLEDFTGYKNQQWILNNTWISKKDHAETDITNPYSAGDVLSNTRLSITIGAATETLTAATLAEHCILENHAFTLDPEFMSEYADKLSETYATLHSSRKFKTTDGREITLKPGNYGWDFDKEALIAALEEHATDNCPVSIKAEWTQSGYTKTYSPDDIGNSYIEVDLGHQKVYLYKNGKLLLDTECVSGLEYDPGRITPEGVYAVYLKNSPAVLRGPGYESYVDYWMPFFGGYGLHDANWRSEFGGEIWKTNGSHGCINMPIPSAKTIYTEIECGYPVVLYY